MHPQLMNEPSTWSDASTGRATGALFTQYGDGPFLVFVVATVF